MVLLPGALPSTQLTHLQLLQRQQPLGKESRGYSGQALQSVPSAGRSHTPRVLRLGVTLGIFGIWIQQAPQGKQVQHSPGSTPQQSSATLRNIFIFHVFFLSREKPQQNSGGLTGESQKMGLTLKVNGAVQFPEPGCSGSPSDGAQEQVTALCSLFWAPWASSRKDANGSNASGHINSSLIPAQLINSGAVSKGVRRVWDVVCPLTWEFSVEGCLGGGDWRGFTDVLHQPQVT